MTKVCRYSLFFLLIIFYAVPSFASGLYIMAEQFPPYSYHEGGEPKGFIVEIVNLMHEKMGQPKPDVHFFPWARGYKKLQTGTGDVLFPMGMTPERSVLFKFVGPIVWDDVYFYRRKGSAVVINSIADAKKVGKIAVTREDLYHHNLKDMGFKNLDVSSSQKSDFLKLIKGRVDLVPIGDKSLSYFIRNTPGLEISDFEKVGPPIFFTTTYIAFALKTADEVVAKWQSVLDESKKDKRWQEILDKYFPPVSAQPLSDSDE